MSENLDVLMLTKYDWANTGWRFQKCLQSLGLKVKFFKGRNHIFNYGTEAPVHDALTGREESKYPIIVRAPELSRFVERAHVIYFMHTTFVNTGVDLQKKYVVVDHGGITYRNEPGKCNEIFNPIADATIGHCPDMLCRGAVNEHLIYYPVDTDLFKPDYSRKGDKLIIGHFPSNPENKGSEIFQSAIKTLGSAANYKDRFEYIGIQHNKWTENTKREWSDNIKLIKSCDVLMETCRITLPDLTNERKVQFGEWGNTAIEASALGVPVITNSLSEKYYESEYGQLGVHVANSELSVITQLKKFIEMNENQLIEEKKKARLWAVDSHSIEATARRMWDKVFCKFFEAR